MNTRLTCRAIQGEFVRLLNGDLTAEAAGAVKAHLDDCASCRQAFFQAASHNICEAQTELTAGIRGASWNLLQTLAAKGERWAKTELQHSHDALRGALALLARRGNQTAETEAPLTLGPAKSVWPEIVRVEMVDHDGKRRGRQVSLHVVQPAFVSRTGRFSLILGGNDRQLAGSKLVCTIGAGAGAKISFEAIFARKRSGSGWEAKIKVARLPRVRAKVTYPFEQVTLFVQGKQSDAA